MRKKIAAQKVLVLGDLILDIYRYGRHEGISTEARVAVGFEEKEIFSAGGAGLVARNLSSLGAQTTFLTVVGDDEYAPALYSSTRGAGLRKIFMREAGRRNVVKTRFLIGGRKVFRWNRGGERAVAAQSTGAISRFLTSNAAKFDKVIVADYRHGVMTRNLAKKVVAAARRAGKPLYVDSQTRRGKSNHGWYRGASVICLNRNETAGVGVSFDGGRMEKSLRRLAKILGAPNMIVKLGPRGAAALLAGKYLRVAAPKTAAKDATGAGDAFLAALAVGGYPLSRRDIEFANTWAALSTMTMGTAPPRWNASKPARPRTQ